MRALVTGATGFVGRRLLAKLGRPVVLSRDSAKASGQLAEFDVTSFDWEPSTQLPPAAAFEGVDTIFHLAGDPVAEGRWNDNKKARIRDSRVLGTRNLVSALRTLPAKPQTLISASAVGYYGNCGDRELDESAPPGPASDFLTDVCIQWENEALAAIELGIRVVLLRIGIVIGEKGGALSKMLTPFSLGVGSSLGSGRQYMPWIHIDDLVEMMLFAASNSNLAGPMNGVAPHPVTNREFTKTLGRVLHRPTFMPALPPLALKIMFGDFGKVLLDSQRAVPRVALSSGFSFHFSELEPALRDVLKK